MDTAKEIAAIFRDEAGPIIAEHFHADEYQAYELVKMPDGYGGFAETEALAESGTCVLERRNSTAGRRLLDGIALTDSDYTAELTDPESVLTTNHRLYINSRLFEVVDVQRDGLAGMFTYAALNEEGPRE